jgi:hypothetical protein
MSTEKLTRFQKFILPRVMCTLKAIAKTGNQYRSSDRLWLDGGEHKHVFWARKAGFIEPKGVKGYVVVGSSLDMVKLTSLGLEMVAKNTN